MEQKSEDTNVALASSSLPAASPTVFEEGHDQRFGSSDHSKLLLLPPDHGLVGAPLESPSAAEVASDASGDMNLDASASERSVPPSPDEASPPSSAAVFKSHLDDEVKAASRERAGDSSSQDHHAAADERKDSTVADA